MAKPFGEIAHEIKPKPWKLGIMYVDSADHRLFVPQRSGIGWTLNFGRPLAWVIIGAAVTAALWRRGRR